MTTELHIHIHAPDGVEVHIHLHEDVEGAPDTVSVPTIQTLPEIPQPNGTTTTTPRTGIIYIPAYPPQTTIASEGWPLFGVRVWCSTN